MFFPIPACEGTATSKLVENPSQRPLPLERHLSEHLAGIADEILLRLDASDPRLKDTLHAAFRAFERIETPDDIAQVAVSCRRFLEGLANMLYPPREGQRPLHAIPEHFLGRQTRQKSAFFWGGSEFAMGP